MDGLSKYFGIGVAIELIKSGKRVCRRGWNGKGMFIYYVKAASYPTSSGVAIEVFPSGMVPYRAYMALKTAQGDVACWSPSGSDALAEDWMEFVEETYEDRLLVEREDLIVKVDKLSSALDGKKVPATSVPILEEQLFCMRNYLDILNRRIG